MTNCKINVILKIYKIFQSRIYFDTL